MTTTIRTAETVFASHWPDVDIPETTLPEFLLAAAAERADEPALVDGPTGRVTTYGELAAGVRGPVPAHHAAAGRSVRRPGRAGADRGVGRLPGSPG